MEIFKHYKPDLHISDFSEPHCGRRVLVVGNTGLQLERSGDHVSATFFRNGSFRHNAETSVENGILIEAGFRALQLHFREGMNNSVFTMEELSPFQATLMHPPIQRFVRRLFAVSPIDIARKSGTKVIGEEHWEIYEFDGSKLRDLPDSDPLSRRFDFAYRFAKNASKSS